MKKSILSICFVLLAAAGMTAQDFGLRVGLNNTSANIDFANAEIDTDGESNLALGIFVNLPIGTELISIQPELTYLNRGYSFSVNDPTGTIEASRTVAYFDVGALVRLNFGADEGLGFYVGAGPFLSYALSGTATELGDERDIDFDADRLRRGELQVAGVVGLTFGSSFKFFVEGRYMGSLSNQADDGDDNTITQRALGINGGVMIPFGG